MSKEVICVEFVCSEATSHSLKPFLVIVLSRWQ